ncbi:hypothetical protein K431DRAFT_228441 [Polychaeton citri CBS 116435]|uniref:Uncharacterized protein n=1 Tax=Polychaeton citri CBS 116435 TaxID=1314669 RepID=A0A9P4UKW7_9PEZI|nr:hypothetical protein K431DRAFT_228441 [Polychaeton citri CBS 116435]
MSDRADFQTEDLRNITTKDQFYEKLSAGKILNGGSESSTGSGGPSNATVSQFIPVPMPIRGQIGSPTALAIGAFATTLTSLSFALTGWRGMSVSNVLIGDFFAVAGIGMVVTAQWEMALGNSYAYTVLSAFGLFYAGFGFIVTPIFGVAEAYGGADTPDYNNALGFFVLMWSVFNLFFLIGSLPLNFVYIMIFLTVQLAFTLVSAGYFLVADGKTAEAKAVNQAAGWFAFASGMFGYYTVGHLMCQSVTAPFGFTWPMGDTSRFFKRKNG